jgi:hypothetical protein
MILFPNYEFGRFNFFLFYDSSGLKIASEFALITILMVGFGVLISANKKRKNINVTLRYTLSQCRKVGWVIVFFTFPIQMYLDLTKLMISFEEGYLSTYETGMAGIWGSLGFMSFTGFTLLILGYKNEKKIASSIFSFVISYLLIVMLTGHRGHQITIILFMLYIFIRTVYKFNAKRLVLIGVFGFIGLAFINTVANYRSIQGKTISLFVELLLDNLRGDSIKDVIVELGGTINTLYLVMQQVPGNISHGYGLTYPAGLFGIIPNLGNVFGDINNYAIYTKSLIGSALGGSYIGELYYNFSYLGLFIAPLVGVFVNKISTKVDNLLLSGDSLKLGYYAPLFTYILWWPRDTFNSMIRPFVWGAILLYIVSSLILKSKKTSDVVRYLENRKLAN